MNILSPLQENVMKLVSEKGSSFTGVPKQSMLSLSQNVPGCSSACPNVRRTEGLRKRIKLYTRGVTLADRFSASGH